MGTYTYNITVGVLSVKFEIISENDVDSTLTFTIAVRKYTEETRRDDHQPRAGSTILSVYNTIPHRVYFRRR